MFRRTRLAALAAALTVTTGCASGGTEATPRTPQTAATSAAPATSPAPLESYLQSNPTASGAASPGGSAAGATLQPRVVGEVATGLEAPWGLAFLPGGDALVSERDTGRIRRVAVRGGAVTEVGTVPGVDPGGEGGLLGLALSPGFERDRLVYAYFTAAEDNRVVRMRYDEPDRLGEPETVLDGLAKAAIHNGGRIAFGPDGLLYVATGDAADRDTPQDRSSLNGKILRLTPDGAPAPGNPFGDSPVYSLGHRNVQGLAWDAQGRLWAGEFGQNTYDELNLIEAGRNYGWPEVEGAGGNEAAGRGFTDPQATWATDDNSPSGIAVAGVAGTQAVFMAGLRGARLWQVPLADGRAGEPTALLEGDYGRLRTVEVAPDGALWLTTSNTDNRGEPREGDDRILRLEL